MSRASSARFDWACWRAEVVERLDRRSIGVLSAWVALSMGLQLAGPGDAESVARHAMFIVSLLLLTLAICAVALVPSPGASRPGWCVRRLRWQRP
jgi:hypothetical protein